MLSSQIFGSGLNLLLLITLVVGLWVASSLLPKLIKLIQPQPQVLAQPTVRIILWLGMGSLLASPLEDLIRWIANILQFLLPFVNVGTVLGAIPASIFSIFSLLLTMIVYGIVFWLSREFLRSLMSLTRVERIFIGLILSSLILHSVNSIITSVIFFPISPTINSEYYGLPGFIIEISAATVILAVIYAIMYRMVFRSHQ